MSAIESRPPERRTCAAVPNLAELVEHTVASVWPAQRHATGTDEGQASRVMGVSASACRAKREPAVRVPRGRAEPRPSRK
jgi:hypothetical protein